MLADGVKIEIGGRELNLVLNTEAMAQIADKYGDVNKVGDMLNGTYSEKIRFVPEIIALLATQGEAIKGSDEVIEPKFISRHTMPRDLEHLSAAFVRAFEIGMDVKYNAGDNGDTDEVLAEIQKNAQSAAGT